MITKKHANRVIILVILVLFFPILTHATEPSIFLPFDEGTGTITVDIINNKQATLNNGVMWLTDCKSEGCISFDGINDIAKLDNPSALIRSESTSPAQQNLVGYWKFDEGSGSEAGDSSGKKNGVLQHNPEWVSGKSGKALKFDNTQKQYVSIPDSTSLDIQSKISVEAWVKLAPGDSFTEMKYIIWKPNAYGLTMGDGTSGSMTKPAFYIIHNGDFTKYAISSSLFPSDGNFHHIVGTYDSSIIKIYIDGEKKGETTFSGSPDTSNYNLGIGNWVNTEAGDVRPEPSSNYFRGEIDEVKIYDKQLSTDEVKELYSPTSSPSTMTLELWVKPEKLAADAVILTNLPPADSSKRGYRLRQASNNRFIFEVGKEGETIVVDSATVFEQGKWYHLAATYDKAALKLYVNGILEATAPASWDMDSTSPLLIGTSGFKGAIDELRIYAAALPADEVKVLATSTSSSSEPNLIAAWSLSKVSGYTTREVNNRYPAKVYGAMLTEDQKGPRGIVSEPYLLGGASSIVASSKAYCTLGTAVVELEFWDISKKKLTPITSKASSVNNEWQQVLVQSDIPSGAVTATVLIKAEPSSVCYFDDASLSIGIPDPDAEVKPLTESILGPFECCSPPSCWTGNDCVANMINDPKAVPINEYRCIDGEWIFTPLVYTPDREKSGYCPNKYQCLIDPDGDSTLNGKPEQLYEGKTPQCIKDGQFFLDNYCMKNKWASRTKLIAAKLLRLVQDEGDLTNYTIYCDRYDASLVDTEYQNIKQYILGGGKAKSIVKEGACFGDTLNAPCVNNFCVLDYYDTFEEKSKHVLGVSLNKPLNDPKLSFLLALGKDQTYCDMLAGDDKEDFRRCSGDNQLWYSPNISSIIFSKDTVSLEGPSAAGAFIRALRHPINTVKSWFTTRAEPAKITTDTTFLNEADRFDRLYLSARKDKGVTAIQETIGSKKFILVQYEGFRQDICAYIDNIVVKKGITADTSLAPITCELDPTSVKPQLKDRTYRVFTDDKDAQSLWPSMTAHLRLTLLDSDKDGVDDDVDIFPKDPTEQFDSDKDEVGDNTDPDDDNDGICDTDNDLTASDCIIKDGPFKGMNACAEQGCKVKPTA